WFAALDGGSDPYRLYSASNLGSFAGLLSYPFAVERTFDLTQQSRIWTIGYVAVAVMIVWCGAMVWRKVRLKAETTHEKNQVYQENRARWVALAMIPASLTLSVTTYISTDIAAIPLVWIVPLSLYLLSLVIAFARPRV